MNIWQKINRPPWRTIVPGICLLLALWLAYALWHPGRDVRDGRDDRGHNGIWLAHGWLGGDDWFRINDKVNEISRFRDTNQIHNLAESLRKHHITDVFPHLCPTAPNGSIPSVDGRQVERFLDEFHDFHVMPWVGGPNGDNVFLDQTQWRAAFVKNIAALLTAHSRLAGVQINIEPLPSGDTNFLALLDELRSATPKGTLISIAAYPPPTMWHPYPDVHWNEAYYHEVAHRSDQLAIMAYDAAQRLPKTYQHLTADWTREALAWSENKPVLIGVPTYKDAGVNYHNPNVENLTNALLGVHRGLADNPLPPNYQGIAIYCEWETSPAEWQYFENHFLNESKMVR